jgi:signal peptidase I
LLIPVYHGTMSGSDPEDVDDRSDDVGESSRDSARDPPPEDEDVDGSNREATSTSDGVDSPTTPVQTDTGATDETSPVSSSRTDGGADDDVTIEDDGVFRWFFDSNDGTVVLVRDVLSSVAIVAVIGLLLFGISGIWPPLVAVESGSMEPNMERGDLIFVVADDRFVGDDPAGGTGVVPLDTGEDNGHDKFGKPGDVVIFQPNGDEFRTPVIHRAHFWVEEGEDWVDTQADEEYVGGATCDQIETCPASHDGFVTKGDANPYYDQYQRGADTDVVQPQWISGKASFRIPWLGYVRLTFDSIMGGFLAPQPSIGQLSGAAGPSGLSDEAIAGAGLGATGVAATGTGIAVAAGRFRRR